MPVGILEWWRRWAAERANDRMIKNEPPTPVIIMGSQGSAGEVLVGTAADCGPALDIAGSAYTLLNSINAQTQNVRFITANESPLFWTAEGAVSSAAANVPWIPITPVAVTADGAGNPPATEIVPLAVNDRLDVMLFIGVDTVSAANQYLFNFREATAAPAPVVPPWVDVEIPSAARGHHPDHTYGFRMITTNVNVNFGVADGANADWPNAATCIFTGFYRLI